MRENDTKEVCLPENAKKKASWIGWLVVLAAFILNLIPMFSQGALSPLAAEIVETYGLSQAQYVSLFTASSLAPIFLSFVAGILLDKFGSKYTIWLVIVAIMCLGTLGMAANSMLPTALAERGMGTASAGTVSGMLAAGMPVGSVIVPAVSNKVKNTKAFVAVLCALCAIAMVATLFVRLPAADAVPDTPMPAE